MPPRSPFQYAILRVVPRVERGECLNAGVVVFARTRDFLGMRVALDADRLRALDPGTDPGPVAAQLEGRARIAAGDPDAGPIARMPVHQRFHWLVAPSSTVVQPSAVHTGLCDDPQETLDRLFRSLVG
ncbi:DUF3037 domain-containing protein [Miltoncostaea oceani]|uniref:DUF3037 domain-containing protein n=1 Tax=Miltoncostaea oceani TaxID=2843216 RepID=UPI001C3D1294|nr:DUF3037 domain-containing protein [Miltoncostaea oceani]